MKYFILCLVVLFLNTSCIAASFTKDVNLNVKSENFKGKKSEIKITFVGHATLIIENNGKVYHIDPWSNVGDYSKLPKADVIFITHEHYDHWDQEAVNQIAKTDTKIFCSKAVYEELENKKLATVLKNGDNIEYKEIRIETVPAYNIKHKANNNEPFHPKGRGNGYILTIDGIRIYIAGDTENVPEIKNLQNIKVAFLPFNLPYTMDKTMFEDLANSIKAEFTYPYHTSGTTQQIINDLNVTNTNLRIRQFHRNK